MTTWCGNFKSESYFELVCCQCSVCTCDGPQIRTTSGKFCSDTQKRAVLAAKAEKWVELYVPSSHNMQKQILVCPDCQKAMLQAIKGG